MTQTTLFKEVKGELHELIDDIDSGDLGLPELQRPFVWEDSKVRDLIDSMYSGFPIGFFLLWESSQENKIKFIGQDKKKHEPKMLILDGQQRLTSLFAIIKNQQVLDKKYKYRKIKIAFNPVTNEFKVADASTEKNKEFISDISNVFNEGLLDFSNKYLKELVTYKATVEKKKASIIKKLKENRKLNSQEREFCVNRLNQIYEPEEIIKLIIAKLGDKVELTELDKSEVTKIFSKEEEYNNRDLSDRIQKLESLRNYPYQALEIKGTIEEEKVAEIFTRINSRGTKLVQTDFILTLISVFWEQGRRDVEDFCEQSKNHNAESRVSPFNYVFRPDPKDIVRIISGLGFKRGRMQDAYLILKGRDLTTRKYSEKLREEQIKIFKVTQDKVLDNTNWHSFLRILIGLGFKSEELITSANNITNSYVFYLIGKEELGVNHKDLERIIGRWFFMCNLTSRYSSSPETQMDADLNVLKDNITKEKFVSALNDIISNTLTNDFWSVTLPKDLLVTSSANSPAGNTFFASLIRNNTNVLFSDKRVSDLFEPSLKERKNPIEKHHIFPDKYLETLGFEMIKRNQIANKTYIEFRDNIDIDKTPPKEYYLHIKKQYYSNNEAELNKNLSEHGIPLNFYELKYEEFLEERRKLITKVIQGTFLKI